MYIGGSVNDSTHWTLIFIALSVVAGHNSSEQISIFIVYNDHNSMLLLCSYVADPPRITTHPELIFYYYSECMIKRLQYVKGLSY